MLHTLYIKVLEAHNLMAVDSNGFSDPYTSLTVGSTTHKTKYIKTTLNPKWEETFVFEPVQSSSTCNVRVNDWNRFYSDKFLGSVDFPLSEYASGIPKVKWFTLQFNDPQQGAVPAGQILLIIHLAHKGGKSLLYTIAPSIARMPSFVLREGTGRLLVEIVEGRCLAPKDITGYSDPYCVLRVGAQSTKSNIKEKTLDPVWNEEFSFEVGNQVTFFTVEIFDWDAIGKDDPMGVVLVGMKDLDDEKTLDQWYSVKPQSNEKVSGQIHLRIQYTSPQNSQKSYIISRDNYIQLAMLLTSREILIAVQLLQFYENNELAKAMTNVFNSERKFMVLLGQCLKLDVDKTPDETALFKVDNPTTKIVVAYFKWVDAQCGYLKTVLMPIINYILENPLKFEVDPEITKQSANSKNLEEVSQRIMDAVFSSDVPAPIREVLTNIKIHIREKFTGSVSFAIGRILYLRFICSAILSPDSFGLIEAKTINGEKRRALTLVSKVVQSLHHSDFPFGDKEPFMVAFNPLVDFNRANYESFILSATEYPREGDEHKHFPVHYTEVENFNYMAIIVKNLNNNLVPFMSSVLAGKDIHGDPARTAEIKLYFDELVCIFSKYNTL